MFDIEVNQVLKLLKLKRLDLINTQIMWICTSISTFVVYATLFTINIRGIEVANIAYGHFPRCQWVIQLFTLCYPK